MRIEVVRTGGFAGIPRTATFDTTTHPDGPHLAALAEKVLSTPPSPHPGVPDGFSYTITAGSRTVRCADPHLTPAQRELIQAVLGEGA
ncbi:hypothetical protein GA0115240_13916 [Streptomyces sp. DvalAA-14]|uniref:protealysin inhibitor emfourin n=1 Tax=unclassified Streptomyces TaxID=2593676 RepID=UPI00081B960E|nr:protealysin inhibitor emfourin [Streptomyces sp. DvalAA-14]MYS22210.1 hypothetical protein [Streptomyces sp. SID4948]SCE11288.1 hypothetical protein GA0115240_13916 [Streptomyces sp. DvalAA-14]